ncbi:MAG TPA: hypothetical protein VFY02_04165 [Gaiellaceae bacterium]|nr:hypothetical protein [Gaiellaceae bacterium]
MMRLVNLALFTAAVGALVVGGVVLGTKIRDDATSELTESIPARAAAATADAQLRAAIFAANTYFVRNSTYVGMTADGLREEVDAGLAEPISVSDATASSYCVETRVGERTFSYRVRRGFLTPGTGC